MVHFVGDLNHTVMVLTPRVQSLTTIAEFKPLSLCNIVHHVIAKVIANNLKLVLCYVISQN